eukprot:TRINITY_DN28264_c0_g1_i1.p1 TRINITY_DN28264_c0_g1~~TRINITY_DN28264_c0_g1_i1.p1  ORF type:complete len:123 (-),score=8.22 TRINITY_DN28264_c0_g1_i1:47-415(-)
METITLLTQLDNFDFEKCGKARFIRDDRNNIVALQVNGLTYHQPTIRKQQLLVFERELTRATKERIELYFDHISNKVTAVWRTNTEPGYFDDWCMNRLDIGHIPPEILPILYPTEIQVNHKK